MNTLKDIAKKIPLLYVEDNAILREKVATLLKKTFIHVDVAVDGIMALEIFKKHHYPLVVTDIGLPKMDGMTLVSHIKTIAPTTKIILFSSDDNKELLYKGIELGVSRFLKKPINAKELSSALYKAVIEFRHEQQTKLFYEKIETIFHHQNSMLVLLNNLEVVLANNAFLSFFAYESVSQCKNSMEKLGSCFEKNEGFLYQHDGEDPLEILQKNPEKIYNVALRTQEKQVRFFLVQYQAIEEKFDYGILSFTDITQLHSDTVVDGKSVLHDDKNMFALLEVLKSTKAKVEVHNFYKGLSITNNGEIVAINEDSVLLKTSYNQQKAIQLEQKVLLASELLPLTIECSEIIKINFEEQTVTMKNIHYGETSPITRKSVRVEPTGAKELALFINEKKFAGDMRVEDISVHGVKLRMPCLVAGLNDNSHVQLKMILDVRHEEYMIEADVNLYRTKEMQEYFYVVFLFVKLEKKNLVKYITKRQMELIREIKGMQNG